MGQLIPCPDCGREISAKAKACPNCGRPAKKKRKPRSGWPWLIILLAIGALVLLSFEMDERRERQKKAQDALDRIGDHLNPAKR